LKEIRYDIEKFNLLGVRKPESALDNQ